MATPREKRIRQRNNRIKREVMDMAKGYGESFLKSIPADAEAKLKEMPHPKLPNSDLTAYSYIEWMCNQGWHKKAKALYQELLLTDETK